jgi:hypothetical protein
VLTKCGRSRYLSHSCHIVSKFHAISYQGALLNRHGFLGTIGATDKTPLTIGTGNKEMYPFIAIADGLVQLHCAIDKYADGYQTNKNFDMSVYAPIYRRVIFNIHHLIKHPHHLIYLTEL